MLQSIRYANFLKIVRGKIFGNWFFFAVPSFEKIEICVENWQYFFGEEIRNRKNCRKGKKNRKKIEGEIEKRIKNNWWLLMFWRPFNEILDETKRKREKKRRRNALKDEVNENKWQLKTLKCDIMRRQHCNQMLMIND